jgi:predicted  nucleic acid-binding Zn-ribbon protein
MENIKMSSETKSNTGSTSSKPNTKSVDKSNSKLNMKSIDKSNELKELENKTKKAQIDIDNIQKVIKHVNSKLMEVDNPEKSEKVLKCQNDLNAEYQKLVTLKVSIAKQIDTIKELHDL